MDKINDEYIKQLKFEQEAYLKKYGKPHYEVFPIWICPNCSRTYQGAPAISRVDNKTEICHDCEIAESLPNVHEDPIYAIGEGFSYRYWPEPPELIGDLAITSEVKGDKIILGARLHGGKGEPLMGPFLHQLKKRLIEIMADYDYEFCVETILYNSQSVDT